jgi:hypothetical protein
MFSIGQRRRRSITLLVPGNLITTPATVLADELKASGLEEARDSRDAARAAPALFDVSGLRRAASKTTRVVRMRSSTIIVLAIRINLPAQQRHRLVEASHQRPSPTQQNIRSCDPPQPLQQPFARPKRIAAKSCSHSMSQRSGVRAASAWWRHSSSVGKKA